LLTRIVVHTYIATLLAVIFPPGLILQGLYLLRYKRKAEQARAVIARHEADQRAEAEYRYLMRVRKAWS